MSYLLNLCYLLLLLALSPWILWAAIRKGKYREGYAAKLLGRVPRRAGKGPCVWLHAVSVGEVNLLQPLINGLAQRRPDLECVVTTTTLTGYRLAKTRYPRLLVCYCPLDFSWAVQRALRRLRPQLLVLAELELWPNLIRAARADGVRVAVINARMGEKSCRGYRRIRPLVTHLLHQIDLIAAQDHVIAHRFVALGAPPQRVHVTGSLKYDGAETDRNNSTTQRLLALAGFTPDDRIFLAGSTQAPEEALALATYRALADRHRELRLVVVPRHPERFDAVAQQLRQSGLAFRRRTELGDDPVADQNARILLVDAVGELGAWWGTATIAFVGGSFTDRGGQNMIEPAAYGAAVCFGPNTWNFRDIVSSLLAARAAVVAQDASELTAFVARCLDNPTYANRLGGRAQALVAGQLGATDRSLTLLESLLDRPASRGDCTAPRAA